MTRGERCLDFRAIESKKVEPRSRRTLQPRSCVSYISVEDKGLLLPSGPVGFSINLSRYSNLELI